MFTVYLTFASTRFVMTVNRDAFFRKRGSGNWRKHDTTEHRHGRVTCALYCGCADLLTNSITGL